MVSDYFKGAIEGLKNEIQAYQDMHGIELGFMPLRIRQFELMLKEFKDMESRVGPKEFTNGYLKLWGLD